MKNPRQESAAHSDGFDRGLRQGHLKVVLRRDLGRTFMLSAPFARLAHPVPTDDDDRQPNSRLHVRAQNVEVERAAHKVCERADKRRANRTNKEARLDRLLDAILTPRANDERDPVPARLLDVLQPLRSTGAPSADAAVTRTSRPAWTACRALDSRFSLASSSVLRVSASSVLGISPWQISSCPNRRDERALIPRAGRAMLT